MRFPLREPVRGRYGLSQARHSILRTGGGQPPGSDHHFTDGTPDGDHRQRGFDFRRHSQSGPGQRRSLPAGILSVQRHLLHPRRHLVRRLLLRGRPSGGRIRNLQPVVSHPSPGESRKLFPGGCRGRPGSGRREQRDQQHPSSRFGADGGPPSTPAGPDHDLADGSPNGCRGNRGFDFRRHWQSRLGQLRSLPAGPLSVRRHHYHHRRHLVCSLQLRRGPSGWRIR